MVLACDNAVPHLLTDEDILTAFQALYTCVRPGGGCLITVRDYDREDRTGIQVKPYGLRIEGSTRYLLFQVWEFRGTLYELALYCIEDRGGRYGIDPRAADHILRYWYRDAHGPDEAGGVSRRATTRGTLLSACAHWHETVSSAW